MAHTPGTWRLETCLSDEDENEILPESIWYDDENGMGKVAQFDMNELPSMDNARIMCAAPDLLEACKEGLEMSKFAAALNFAEDTGNTQEFLDELDKMLDHFQTTVRAAIAKAEGG